MGSLPGGGILADYNIQLKPKFIFEITCDHIRFNNQFFVMFKTPMTKFLHALLKKKR